MRGFGLPIIESALDILDEQLAETFSIQVADAIAYELTITLGQEIT
jgi:hypothetical protein